MGPSFTTICTSYPTSSSFQPLQNRQVESLLSSLASTSSIRESGFLLSIIATTSSLSTRPPSWITNDDASSHSTAVGAPYGPVEKSSVINERSSIPSTIPTASYSTLSASGVTATPTSGPEPTIGLGTSAIIGVSIGAASLVILLVVGAFWLGRRRTRNHNKLVQADPGYKAELDGNITRPCKLLEADAGQEVVEVEGRHGVMELNTQQEAVELSAEPLRMGDGLASFGIRERIATTWSHECSGFPGQGRLHFQQVTSGEWRLFIRRTPMPRHTSTMAPHHKATCLPQLALTLLSTRTPYTSQPWAPSTAFSRKPLSSGGAAIAVASGGRQKKLATNVRAAGTEGAGGSVGASKLK